jgi:predicted Zn-dependent protease
MMFDEKRARAMVERVMSLSQAEEAHVSLSGEETKHLRFSRNTPSTSGAFSNVTMSVSSHFGKRTGSTQVNQFDEDSVVRAVRRSEEIARLAPEDPEHMPALGPQTYVDIPYAPPARTPLSLGVARCIEDARQAEVVAAGFAEAEERFSCLATSKGLFAYQNSSSAYIAETARTEDGAGSGWAAQAGRSPTALNYAGVSQAAIAKALRSQRPRKLAPGRYPTILEPACVANMVGILVDAMDAREADEGRSFFSKPGGGNRLGEKLFPDGISIRSDPRHPDVTSGKWGEGGLPQTGRDWIKSGRVENLAYGRFWADKYQREPVPRGGNIIMDGGKGSVDELIRGTKRGVLVTSLWYIRSVDPRTLLYTGLTRDGVFWIENGEIAYPIHNFRWNDSPVAVLKNVVARSRAEVMPPRPSRAANYIVPALKLSEFHFSSESEAV